MTNLVNKIFTFVVSLLLLTLLSGCNKIYHYHVDSYVLEYMECDRIEMLACYPPSVGYPGLLINEKASNWVSFKDTGYKKERFDELAQKHNDTGYNRDVGLVMDIPHPSCIYPDIISYLVTSDKDFDETHPAGTSLNDLIEHDYCSFGRYVKSGYNEEYITYESKLLSQFTIEDGVLMTGYGFLKFTQKPTIDGIHTITVTIKSDDGRTFSDSVEFDFSKMTDVQ